MHYAIIPHGPQASGKTTLLRRLFIGNSIGKIWHYGRDGLPVELERLNLENDHFILGIDDVPSEDIGKLCRQLLEADWIPCVLQMGFTLEHL